MRVWPSTHAWFNERLCVLAGEEVLQTWSNASILNAMVNGQMTYDNRGPVGGCKAGTCCAGTGKSPLAIVTGLPDDFIWPEVLVARSVVLERLYANKDATADWDVSYPLWKDKAGVFVWPERVEPNEFDVGGVVQSARYRLVGIGCHIGHDGLTFFGGHWLAKVRYKYKGWFLADDLGGRSHKMTPQPEIHRDKNGVTFIYVRVK